MVTPNSIVTPQGMVTADMQFTAGTGGTEADLFTAGANGSIVRAINIASTDTSARKFYLKIQRSGGSARYIGVINIPVEAGTKSDASVPSVDGLSTTQIPSLPLDADGNPYILLAAGDKLRAVLDANCTTGKVVDVALIGENY